MPGNFGFTTAEHKTLRKLSKGWRRANQIYEILMILLSISNIILTVVNGNRDIIPELYFEIYACIITLVPVAWSKILDTEKKMIEVSTPPDTPTNITQDPSTHQNMQPIDRMSSALSPTLSTQSTSTRVVPYMQQSSVRDAMVFSEMPEIVPQFVDNPVCDVNNGVYFYKTQNGKRMVQSAIIKPTPNQLIERGRSMSEITRTIMESVVAQMRSQLSPSNQLEGVPSQSATPTSQSEVQHVDESDPKNNTTTPDDIPRRNAIGNLTTLFSDD